VEIQSLTKEEVIEDNQEASCQAEQEGSIAAVFAFSVEAPN